MYHIRQNKVTGYWTDTDDPSLSLVGVHKIIDCRKPCAIHNTASSHNLSTAPLVWRDKRGSLERICEHGLFHIDYDTAMYYHSINLTNENVHVCDGCCGL